jgi:hypothetical protein
LKDYFKESGKLVSISGGTGGYWLRAFTISQSSNEYKEKYVDTGDLQKSICALLNSSLFYIIWREYSDCRHLTDSVHSKIYIDLGKNKSSELCEISERHQSALIQTLEIRTGKMTYEQYRPSKSKPIIDEIDKVLAKHYGFTEEELDFIINYDIKYRMGGELEGEE